MFGFSTKEEKEAYKAGIRKGEKNAAASNSVNADALASLWAALGAANQTEAMETAESWRDTYLAIASHNEKLELERDEALRERQSIITAQANAIDGAQRRINELVERDNQTNAAFNSLSDAKSKVMAALTNSERECNRLSKELEASKAMGAYYLRQSKYPLGDFPTGSPVTKKEGYGYPGEVVAAFRNKIGQLRYVVEATGDGYEGMLHIFNGDQLKSRLITGDNPREIFAEKLEKIFKID